MIELMGWICLVISLVLMLYHHYMYTNYDEAYNFMKRKYGQRLAKIKLPSRDDHFNYGQKFSYYTAGFAALLIILNLLHGE
ncbi:MAG: hypothetical protein JSS06_07810 [Proteobacteria bacterium]|nr:hypothetical protein [Pseudomonadota bacterium]